MPRLGTRWVVDAGPEAGGVPPFPGGFRPLLCVFWYFVVTRGGSEDPSHPPVPVLRGGRSAVPLGLRETQAVFSRTLERFAPDLALNGRAPLLGVPATGTCPRGAASPGASGLQERTWPFGIRPAAYAPESTKLGHGDPFLGAGESPLGKPSWGLGEA